MTTARTKQFLLLNQDVDTSFLTLEMTWRGIREPVIGKEVGIPVPAMFEEIIDGKTINTYVEQSGYKPFVEHCAHALFSNHALRRRMVMNTEKLTLAMMQLARHFLPQVEHLSIAQTQKLLTRISSLQSQCARYGCVVAFADIFGDVTNAAVAIVQKCSSLRYPEHIYTTVLGNPVKSSRTELAYEFLRASPASSDQLARRYFWLEQGYCGRGITVRQIEVLRKRLTTRGEVLPKRRMLEQELHLSHSESNIFSTLRDVIYAKSLRADARQFLHVLTNRIIDRFAKEQRIAAKYVETLSAKEFLAGIQKTVTFPDNLKERWKQSVIIPQADGTYEILVQGRAKEYLARVLIQERLAMTSEVHGQTAFPGNVRGRARLVFGPQHNTKVRKGDILIAVATSPQLLPAMKKAGAFVTDIGGITSHAAIVARELHIPCIVGTKYATQIFQDGEQLNVDATKGTVRKV